jgi:hypothetical protein
MRRLLSPLLAATVLAAAGPVSAVTFIDFEGLPDLTPITTAYAGVGVVFSPSAYAVVDGDNGGSGDFANEPSPNTAMAFIDAAAVLTVAAGFDTGFSFWYASPSSSAHVSLLDANNKSVGEADLPALGAGVGDPTGGDYGKWATVGIALTCAGQPGCKAYSVVFGGQPLRVFYDNVTFGSLTPGPGTPSPIPEPSTWALLGLGLTGVLAKKRRPA